MWLESLGGRKFVLAVLALGVGAATAALSPKGLSTELVALILGIVGAFGATNAFVSSKAISSGAEGVGAPEPVAPSEEPQPQPVVDMAPILERIAQAEQAAAIAIQSAQSAQQGLQQVGRTAENAAKLAQASLNLKQG